jgi:hypothetical protein
MHWWVATLVQLCFQHGRGPSSALGPNATGPNEGSRLYQLRDGWIFAEAPTDISSTLANKTVAEALNIAHEHAIRAVPVSSIASLRQRYLARPSTTIRFRTVSREGLRATRLEPTWFQIDGKPIVPSSEPPLPGGDAASVLAKLGFDEQEVAQMIEKNVIGLPNWRHLYGRAEVPSEPGKKS